MEVLQKAAATAGGIMTHAVEAFQYPRNVEIYVSNGTEMPVSVADSSGTECETTFQAGLEPGCAGAIRYVSKGELKGEVKLSFGGKDFLGIWVHFSRLGFADVMLQFSKDAKLPRKRWVGSSDEHFSFTLSGLSHAAHVRIDTEGSECIVHLLLGPREGLTRHSRRPSLRGQQTEAKFSGRFLFEGFNSLQFLAFAEWCRVQNSSGLAGALFLMEYTGVLAGLQGVSVADRAFMLNLLICAFIVNGALYMHSLVSAAALEPYLRSWGAKEPEPLSKGRRTSFDAYKAFSSEDEADLRAYVDAAILLLKTASIQCWLSLAGSAQQLVDRGALLSPLLPERPSGVSTMSESEKSRTDEVMFQKLGTLKMKEEASSRTAKSHEDSNSEKKLMAMVRKCVHTSASFSHRSNSLFQEVEASLPEGSARKALRCYRDWVPAAVRRFDMGSMDGEDADEVMGIGGKRCCPHACSSSGRRKRNATVHCSAIGSEVFTGLDGGELTHPKQVIQSLGIDSLPYRTMSTNSKSGEFFFFSGDRRYLIKTISEEEGKLLFSMLPGYQAHLRSMPQSLIVRYAGLLCLYLDGIGKKYFSVMSNVFDPVLAIHDTFDVKGSMFKRKKKEGEKIGKDEDWVTSHQRLCIAQETCAELCAAHEQDAQFLQSHGVMDYSVLIGIHNTGTGDGVGADSSTTGIWSADAKTLYFVGIIDFLIKYGISKQGEHFLRFAQGHSEDASCVDPWSYARRQVRFVRDQVVAVPGKDVKDLMGTVGKLRVKVRAAHGLRIADVTGLSDPYVNVSLGLQRQRTPTVVKNCDPKWNAILNFAIDEAHTHSEVEFSVMDEDVGALQGTDDFLGRLAVPVANIIEHGSIELCQEPLKEVKQGRLSVKLEFVKTPVLRFSL